MPARKILSAITVYRLVRQWLFSAIWALALIFGLLISFSPENGIAQQSQPVPRTLLELNQALKDLPSDERAIVDQVSELVFRTSLPLMNSLISSTQPSEAQAFVSALSSGADPVVTARLVRAMKENGASYLRFIDALQKRIQQNPILLKKVESALTLLQKHVEQAPIPSIPIGQRLLNSALFGASVVGFVYSFYGSFVSPSGDAFLDFSRLTAQFLGFHLLINVVAEIRVIKIAFRTWKKARAEKSETLKIIDDLKTLLADYKNEPLLKAVITENQFLGSQRANIDAQKTLPIFISKMMSEIDRLRKNPAAYSQLQAFYQTKEFLNLVEHLNATLTNTEKRRLLDQLPPSIDRDAFLYVDPVALQYEQRIIQAFQSYLNNPANNVEELRNAVLRRSESEIQRVASDTQMDKWNTFNNLSLSVGITVMGMLASIGKLPVPIDAAFSLDAIEWIRAHTTEILRFGAISTLPSIARFYWEMGKNSSGRKARQNRTQSEIDDRLSTLLRILHSDFLLNEIEQTRSKIDGVYELDAETMIDSLLKRPSPCPEFIRTLGI